jgi:hypothetical protein
MGWEAIRDMIKAAVEPTRSTRTTSALRAPVAGDRGHIGRHGPSMYADPGRRIDHGELDP